MTSADVPADAGHDGTKDKDSKEKHRFSSFTLIMASAMAGVACGLFFGEYCRSLSLLGNAYIGLLQMTVLPYIVFSLIGNIGRQKNLWQ